MHCPAPPGFFQFEIPPFHSPAPCWPSAPSPGPRVVPTRSAWPIRVARHNPNPAIPLCVGSSASPLNCASVQPSFAAVTFNPSSFVIHSVLDTRHCPWSRPSQTHPWSFVYKTAYACDIALVVSKTRPRAVRTFWVPILTTFSFSGAEVETVRPVSTVSCP